MAMGPDGSSLITAMGFRQRALWIHDNDREREISSVGDASEPMFSRDGRNVYYLLREEPSNPSNQLCVTDLVTGKTDVLVTEFFIRSFDISGDGREAVLATGRLGKTAELWLVTLDRHAAPRKIASSGEDSPSFGPDGEILFKVSEG